MLSKSLVPLLLCGSASGFVVAPSRASSSRATALFFSTPSTPTFVANKYYQLEELEDKDDCSTEVYLKGDGTVTVGETDGPPPVESSGSWELAGNIFKMTLSRQYEGGEQPSRSTDVGEFKYEVKRSYEGELGHVGEEMAVTGGKIHSIHEELGDEEVGFFNIIDTTDSKEES